MTEGEVAKQLSQIAQALRFIKDDIDATTYMAETDRKAYREEIAALRGDLGLYLYEQVRQRADLDDLKKKLRRFPNSYRL